LASSSQKFLATVPRACSTVGSYIETANEEANISTYTNNGFYDQNLVNSEASDRGITVNQLKILHNFV